MKAQLHLVRPVDKADLLALARMGSAELHRLYKKRHGTGAPAGNPELARRRLAWLLQADREGGVPQSAREFALTIARSVAARGRIEANLSRRDRGLPLAHSVTTKLLTAHDSRLPMPGSILVKEYGGRTIIVHVLQSEFECDGKRYKSLSALAQGITGKKWNGFGFFGLAKGRPNAH